MKILARVKEPDLLEAVTAAANQLGAELILVGGASGGSDQQLFDALRTHPTMLFVEAGAGDNLARLRAETRARGIGLVAACTSQREVQRVLEVGADEWLLLPTTVSELTSRFQGALRRRREGDAPDATTRAAEHLR